MAPKKNKDLTDDEKFEVQLQVDQDLGRLSRQYKILEMNLGFSEKGSKLQKQEKVLNIFKREQNNIRTDLSVATARGKIKDDEQTLSRLDSVLNNYDKFDKQIKTKKSRLNEISEQVRKFERQLLELSSQQITEQQQQDRVLTGRKTVEALENKLEVQIKQFCTICSKNHKLRQEINHLLIERCEFNKIWEKLINNLHIGKKFMLDLIEQATIAYDQREELVSKLQFLRNKAHTDLIMHITDMREVQRKIDNNTKLQEFILVKGQKRIMKDLELKEQLKRNQRREEMEKQLTEYKQILTNVKEFTGEANIEIVVTKFLIQEEENFALFKYVNDLNREMENLNDSLNLLHIEIDYEKALQNIRNFQQHDTLESLRTSVDEATLDTDLKNKELTTIEEKLKGIMNGIEKLFISFQCSRDPLIQLLGSNENINYYNVLLYLEVLEKKIHESMVKVYHQEKMMFDKRKTTEKQMVISPESYVPSIYSIEIIAQTNPCPLCVEHELVSDVIDDLQYALTKEQIQEKLEERLKLQDGLDRLHNVSACHLPKSREIIQKRYQ